MHPGENSFPPLGFGVFGGRSGILEHMIETVPLTWRPEYATSPVAVPMSRSLAARGWVDEASQALDAHPRALGSDQLLDLAADLARASARLDAKKCETAAVFALRHRDVNGFGIGEGLDGLRPYGGDGTPWASQFCVYELAVELHCSETAATDLISVGLDLGYRLECTRSDFGAGRIDYPRARVISEETRELTERQAAAVDPALAEAALTRTPGKLRSYARRRIARLYPDTDKQQAADAFRKRYLSVFSAGHGMGVLWLTAPLDVLALIDERLTEHARAHRDGAANSDSRSNREADTENPSERAADNDRRGLDARRCDLAVNALLGYLSPANATMRPASTSADQPAACDVAGIATTTLRVTMTADALLGVTDEPAELDGYGPITAEQARLLALQSATTTIRRLFTDPVNNAVMVYDANRYTFTRTQQAAIRVLHPRCVFPGCRTRSERCDTDHREPYRRTETGPDPPRQTTVDNGQPLCRRHHRLKTFGQWKVVCNDTHTYTWTSPTGHTHIVEDNHDP